MDVIRTIVSYIGESEKKSDLELTTQISAAVAYVIASYNENDTSELNDEYTVASSMLSNNASDDQLQALDDILILYAEHGFNASTFATSCLLYTSPSPRDVEESRMPSSA